MTLSERAKTLLQVNADLLRVAEQIFGFDDVKHGHGCPRGHRIAAERIEIAGSPAKLRQHFGTTGDASDGVTIAHRLAHGHKIGQHAVALKAPHRIACAAKAGLNFIRNIKPTCSMDRVDRALQETRRGVEHAIAGENAITDEQRWLDAMALEVLDRAFDMGRELRGHVAGRASVDIGCRNGADIHPKRHVLAQRGRKTRHRLCHAMISRFGHDDTLTTGAAFRDAHGKIIGFGPGAGEHQVPDFCGHGRQKTLGINEHVIVQIAGVCGQRRHLAADRSDHSRVAMPDGGNVVVGVQIGVAIGIIKPRPLTAHKMNGTLIKQAVGRTKQSFALLDDARGHHIQFDSALYISVYHAGIVRHLSLHLAGTQKRGGDIFARQGRETF